MRSVKLGQDRVKENSVKKLLAKNEKLSLNISVIPFIKSEKDHSP